MITKDDLKKHFGSTEKVASFFGCTIQAVGSWRNKVPKSRIYELNVRLPKHFPPTKTGSPRKHG